MSGVTIIYHSEHGITPQGTDVYFSSEVTPTFSNLLPTLVEYGYKHVGWYTTSTFTEGTEVTEESEVDLTQETVHLYAKWIVYVDNIVGKDGLTYFWSKLKVILDEMAAQGLTDELKALYDAAYSHSQTAHAPSDAEANVIETVKVNGTALTPADKAVDITVPTDYAASSHNQAASTITAGTLAGKVLANASAVLTYNGRQVRNILFCTSTSGISVANGDVIHLYE